MDKPIIEVNNLDKNFVIPREKRDTLKSYVINPFRKIPKETFRALNDVSFSINAGEFVGLIGRNGSGKSTLLQLIAGIYAPTSGSVTVRGSIVPFLQLGVGFNDNLSGRENVFLNGAILGMSRKYLEKKYEEIVDFAEIEDFMDLQLKNYSSGMRVRLALAIAVQAKADIYLLDEVLSVGDESFRQKSLKKMQEMLTNGATVMYVSHGLESIEQICSRVIYLEDGKLAYDGNVTEGLSRYRFSLLNKATSNNESRFGSEKKSEEKPLMADVKTEKIEIESIMIDEREDGYEVESNKDFLFKVNVKILEDIDEDFWLGAMFSSVDIPTSDVYGFRYDNLEKKIQPKAGDRYSFEIKSPFPFNPGSYVCKFKIGSHVQVKRAAHLKDIDYYRKVHTEEQGYLLAKRSFIINCYGEDRRYYSLITSKSSISVDKK